jgi:hydrophobic/amphiphilic exporter-1 (mainly G- bacteria), HAE1 family
MPPHTARTSPPHADRSTNNSSRGRIGRSTSAAAGGLAGAAPGAAVLFVPTFFAMVQRFESWLASRNEKASGASDAERASSVTH